MLQIMSQPNARIAADEGNFRWQLNEVAIATDRLVGEMAG